MKRTTKLLVLALFTVAGATAGIVGCLPPQVMEPPDKFTISTPSGAASASKAKASSEDAGAPDC